MFETNRVMTGTLAATTFDSKLIIFTALSLLYLYREIYNLVLFQFTTTSQNYVLHASALN
jgi:hypothetical protein